MIENFVPPDEYFRALESIFAMKQPAWRRTGASRAGSSLQVSLPDGGFGGCVNHGIWRSSEDAVS